MNILNSLGKAIGLGFGSGRFPIAPGTVGSLAAAGIYYLIPLPNEAAAPYLLLGLILPGLPLGVWATGLLATPQQPDPGRAVWDEFVGMWVGCLLLPRELGWLLAAFLCFRVFDVVKPWPARQLERWPGGWGIMADDVAAGLYGAALLNLVRLAWQAWGG